MLSPHFPIKIEPATLQTPSKRQQVRSDGHLRFRFLLVALMGVQVLSPTATRAADVLSEIANGVHTEREYLVLNLPPRPGAWPGAIFSFDMRVPIVRGDSDDSALARGEPTNIQITTTVNLAAGAKAGWGSLFGIAADAGNVASATMIFEETRVIDIQEGDLERRVNQSTLAKAAARQGRIPQVIYKAYEAVPTLILTKQSSASAEAWATLQKKVLDSNIKASAATFDTITYRTLSRVVFAFEVMQATFLTSDAVSASK